MCKTDAEIRPAVTLQFAFPRVRRESPEAFAQSHFWGAIAGGIAILGPSVKVPQVEGLRTGKASRVEGSASGTGDILGLSWGSTI